LLADRQDGRLPWWQVVGEIDRADRGFAAARGRRRFEDGFLRDA